MSIDVRCIHPSSSRNNRNVIYHDVRNIHSRMNRLWPHHRKGDPPKSLSHADYQASCTSFCHHESHRRFCPQYHRWIDYRSKLSRQYPDRNRYYYGSNSSRNTTGNRRFWRTCPWRVQQEKSTLDEFSHRPKFNNLTYSCDNISWKIRKCPRISCTICGGFIHLYRRLRPHSRTSQRKSNQTSNLTNTYFHSRNRHHGITTFLGIKQKKSANADSDVFEIR